MWRERTHLVVHGLCGWRRSQRLVDPASRVEGHGLRRLALGPETLRKHPLLIVEILTDTQTNTQILIKDPNIEKSDNSSFSGVQVLASAQESLKNKSTAALLVWKHSFVWSQVGKMTSRRCWTLTCSIGEDPTCLCALTALFSTYVCIRQWFPRIHLTLAGCQGVLTAAQEYCATHFSFFFFNFYFLICLRMTPSVICPRSIYWHPHILHSFLLLLICYILQSKEASLNGLNPAGLKGEFIARLRFHLFLFHTLTNRPLPFYNLHFQPNVLHARWVQTLDRLQSNQSSHITLFDVWWYR